VNFLVIGGTRFLGPHFVNAALARNHRVTVFNRGSKHLPDVPDLAQRKGDRRTGLETLGDATFDAVVDTCAYHPADIVTAAPYLAGRCSRYCLISTASVYAAESGDLDENATLVTLPTTIPDTMTPETYGALKALCEQAADHAFGNRLLIVRPGLIVGPGDATHRFGYWVRRIARGGDIVAPDPPDAPVEFIDVRDLAAWLVMALERELAGIYNANGPGKRTTMSEFLAACTAMVGTDVHLHWVPAQHLLDSSVEPWVELPLWIPSGPNGFLSFNAAKAQRDGLSLRPIDATIAAARAWDLEHGPPDSTVRTLTAAKEAAILAGLGRDVSAK
jgi:nucleoside-diphosphate-sugar epimerase